MSPKAHAEERNRRPAGAAFAALLMAASFGIAHAAALGEIELRSYLGEHFDARIPISANEGESMDLACFSLARPEAEGPAVTRAQLAVEGEGAQARLRIRSNRPWNEPVANVRVRFFCARTGPVIREYALAIDPRGAVAPPVRQAMPDMRALPAPAPVPVVATASATATVAAISGRLRAVSGDTLAGIAKAIYPQGRKLQQAFIDAMRADNPALAALKEDEPIPEGTEVALPDLRDFANSAKVAELVRLAVPVTVTETPAHAAPAPAAPVPAKAKAAPERKASAPAPAGTEAKPEPGPLRPPSVSARGDGGFQLRLSTGDIDLSRSRGMNDEKRDRLRERQLVLDSDDQVAALLALRHSLRQLETRVAEMQLRLTTSTPAIAPAAARAETRPAAAVAPPAPPVAPPPPAKPAEVAKPVEAAKPVAPLAKPAEVAKPVEVARPVEPAKASAPATQPAAAGATPARPESAPAPPAAKAPEPAGEELPIWLWGVVALLVAAVAWLAWRIFGARRSEDVERETEPGQGSVSELDMATDALAEEVLDEEEPEPEPQRRPSRIGEMTMQVAAYRPAPQMESDASLTTRVSAGDPNDLRRRYIEERFPELANRTISLEDSDSIVKGARLFYEDGANSRAIELLTFAIEERPGQVKNWLALFEIYRLENMAAEFADLASRFHATHGNSEYWPKIQFIGREIDPQHPLYSDGAAFNNLETIGYTSSRARDPRRFEFDPLAENWLNAPMDFMTDALASDLRRAVMAEHGVSDADMAPNPMPALKNVEVFGGD